MKTETRLIRSVRFFALHHLRRPDWDDAQNRAAYGALADPAGHGHDYACTVEVGGPLEHGMIIDLAELDRLLDAVVRKPLDGKHLNHDVPEFGTTPPTCEALAAWVYRRLLPQLPAMLSLHAVRITEDDSLAAEVRPA